jgi:cyclomaltodextrinase
VTLQPPAWVADAVFYQIFPDRFGASERVVKPGPLEPWDSPPTVSGFKGGDLLGVVEHLDYLVELGITAIYFNPIFQSASNHRYHTYDYLAVDPLLGGDAALRELIDECHARGLRIVLDGVFNHASRGFWPFHHVMETGLDSPYREWFNLNIEQLAAGRPLRAYPDESTTAPLNLDSIPDWARFGRASLERFGYEAWWDLPALPKLNTQNPQVREYLLGVAEHWLRFGIDGWRLDVAEEIPEDFWREFRQRVKAIDPEAYIVAEIWQDRPTALDGDQYDALMNYPLAEAILSFVGGPHLDPRIVGQHFELAANIRPEDGPTFARRMEHVMTRYEPQVVAAQLNLLGSHDTPRAITVCGGDAASMRLATLIQMTVAGAPSIYYGDEIGMAGEHDPGCRGAFPWDRPDAWQHDLRAFTADAIAFRRDHPVLRHGDFRVVGAEGTAAAYVRAGSDGSDAPNAPIVVAVNAGEAAVRLNLHVPELDGCRLTSHRWAGWPAGSGAALPGTADLVVADGRLDVEIPARDALVLEAVPA